MAEPSEAISCFPSVVMPQPSLGYFHEDLYWSVAASYIKGKVWANVYTSDEIVIINPRDGSVEGIIDCRGLLPKELYAADTDVLNGIAYDKNADKIYLTGKNWPKLYEVRLVKKK